MIDPTHYDCHLEPEEAATAERRQRADSLEQLRADAAELKRIREFARKQSMIMDRRERSPTGDDWNDLYAQVRA
ncbi:hypothetical protein [Methylorubrum populi]|uniref:hypothetical protein n=1 Tax=Methylorubrum populi TaxID=223967 RepID=UPI000DB053DF|nr:hypothetical protein [Methylorubrum populi]PZP71802.1 MAG: hypothetical protein DI590_05945 [Methylorubrum populi]